MSKGYLFFKFVITLIIAMLISTINAQVLNVPAVGQYPQSNWCWVASSKAVLDYYGSIQNQCDIANYALSQVGCCGNPSPCNVPKNHNDIINVLSHFGNIQSTATTISLAAAQSEINNQRPFLIHWKKTNGDASGGHWVVCYGVIGNFLFIMDPLYGKVYMPYSEVENGIDQAGDQHQWDLSIKLTTSPINNFCTDVHEPNNNGNQATPVFAQPLTGSANFPMPGTNIGYYADQDWFSIDLNTPGNLEIDLTDLPNNYDVQLYSDAAGTNSLTPNYIPYIFNDPEHLTYSNTSSSLVRLYAKVFAANPNDYWTHSCYKINIKYTANTTCQLTGLSPSVLVPGSSNSPGQTINTTTPILSWNSISGATNYGVYIRDVATGVLVVDADCASITTSYTVPAGKLSYGRQYLWNVIAYTGCNASCASNSSNPLYFQVQSTNSCSLSNSTPTLTNPGTSNSPGQTLSTLTPTLTWGAVPGATNYGVYVRDLVSNSLIVNVDCGGSATSYPIPSGILSNGGQYRWNVIASIGCSGTCNSAYAAPLYFNTQTTSCALSGVIPTIVSPGVGVTPGQTINGTTPTLTWNAVAGATNYDVFVKDMATNNLVVNQPCATTGTTYNVPSGILSAGGQYSWYIKANISCGSCVSSYSSSLYFQINSGCGYTLSSYSASVPVGGASNNSFTVNSTSGCNWSATTSDPAWITLNNTNGSGTASVSYSIASNPGNNRTGFIYVQGNTYSVNQAGVSCQTPATPIPQLGTTSCPGSGLSSGVTNVFFYWSTTGPYYYNIEVREYPFDAANIIYTQTCISGTSVTVNSPAIVPGKSYCWRVQSSADCANCNSSFSPFYYFHIVPELSPNSTTYVCNGAGTILSTPSITVPSGASVSYNWYYGLNSNSTPISGQTGNTCNVTQSGYYYVKATFSGSSVCNGIITTDQSSYTYVSIASTPVAPVLSSNSPVCEGNTLTLSTPYINGNLYYWTGPNGFTSNNTSISIQTATATNAGSYSCYVVNSGCQSSASSTSVTVNPAPAASFTYNAVGNTVTFTNTSTNATSYSWTLGDNQSSTQTSPSHTYSTNGNFNVCLTANSSGCSSSSNCQSILLGDGSSSITLPTFAKLFKDTTTNHIGWVCYDIIQSTVDSGYIGVGWYQTQGVCCALNTIQYFKLSKNGTLLWARAMPEFTSAGAYKIIKSQNGYLISMYYNLTSVMEIDEQGNKLWGKQVVYNVHDTISNTNYQFGINNFTKAGSSGYVGVGSYSYTHYIDNFGTPNSTVQRCGIILVKIDNSGNLVWQKLYAYSLYSNTSLYVSKLAVDGNGNIYLSGNISDAAVSPPSNSYDGLLVKVDASGNHQWSKYYATGANIEDGITALVVDNNSDVVFTGYSRQNNITTGFITKVNSSGTVSSSKQCGSGYSVNVFNTNTNAYDLLVYGYPSNFIGISTLNNSLTVTNEKKFNFKSVYSAKATLDNKFVVCGQYLFNTGDYRYNVFKASYSNISCLDTTATNFTLSNISFPLSSLSVSTSTPSVTLSNFAISPSVSFLSDTDICHQCNLSATVTPNGNTTFCSGGNVTLSANLGMVSYLWSNGQTTQTITAAQTGSYSVSIADSYLCSATSGSVLLTVNPLPYADAGIDKTICNGTNTLIGTSQILGNSYSWSPSTNLSSSQIAMPSASPSSQTTYTVTVTNSFGCTASDQVTLSVNAPPTVTANSTLPFVCVGSNVILTGGGANTYSWSNGVIDGAPVTVFNNATYSVTGTDVNGCQNTATVTINTNPLPSITITATSDSVCSGSSITLSGNGANSYSWSNGVVNATPFSPTVSTTYTVTGTDVNGCQNTATKDIAVIFAPTAFISYSPNGSTYNFSSNSQGNPTTFIWSFGDGDSSNVANPVHTYTQTGSITVTLTVTNSCGSNNYQSVININPNCTYSLNPTAIVADSNGISTTVNVTCGSSCPWNVNSSNCAWLTVNPSNGIGSTTFNVTIPPTSDTVVKQCTIIIEGQQIAITQYGKQGSIACAPIDTSVQVNGCDLASANISGATYQWYRNGVAISGATSRYYTATLNGYYHIQIGVGNCIYQSNDHYLNCITGIEESYVTSLAVFPNPTDGAFIISCEVSTPTEFKLNFYNTVGQILYTENFVSSGKINKQLKIENLPSGIYHLQLSDGRETFNRKIVIR